MTKPTRSEKDKAQAQAREKEMELFDAIVSAEDRPFRDVIMPEWNDLTVRVITFSGEDRDDLDRETYELGQAGGKGAHLDNFRARTVARALVHPDTGKRIFDTPAKIKALSAKSGKAIDRLYDIQNEFNKTSVEPEAEGKNS